MIQPHDLRLYGSSVTLRPFTETDLYRVLLWSQDAEIASLCEGNDIAFQSVDDVRPIYEGLSRQGHLFIIEADGRSIGECCLQRMNLDWVKERYADERIYRLPILIGDKRYWGRGCGKEVVTLLLEYAFRHLDADRFFIPSVWAFNQRSLNLWKGCGFREVERRSEMLNRQRRVVQTEAIFLILTRADFGAQHLDSPEDTLAEHGGSDSISNV